MTHKIDLISYKAGADDKTKEIIEEIKKMDTEVMIIRGWGNNPELETEREFIDKQELLKVIGEKQ